VLEVYATQPYINSAVQGRPGLNYSIATTVAGGAQGAAEGSNVTAPFDPGGFFPG
jgi:hypothetical protein